MKKLLLLIAVFGCPLISFCQDISGHWKGTLYNDSTGQTIDYEVVIKKEKGRYSAFSCTNYQIEGKKYFGVKKLNIRMAKDGKIVMQDVALLEHNCPVSPNKNVLQLNVLDLVNQEKLEGLFVTNSSKEFKGLTGNLSLKRISQDGGYDLLSYFKKTGNDQDITAK